MIHHITKQLPIYSVTKTIRLQKVYYASN